MRLLLAVMVAAVGVAAAPRCSHEGRVSLMTMLEPVVEACAADKCSPACRESLGRSVPLSSAVKACIVAARTGSGRLSGVPEAVISLVRRGPAIVSECAELDAAVHKAEASPSPSPGPSPSAMPPPATQESVAELEAAHTATKHSVSKLTGRVGALEGSQRQLRDKSSSLQHQLDRLGSAEDVAAEEAEEAVEDGVKDIKALAEKMESAQAAAAQQQVGVKSATQAAVEKAAEANYATGGMHKTQEEFAKATLRRAAEQTAEVQKQVAEATRRVENEVEDET